VHFVGATAIPESISATMAARRFLAVALAHDAERNLLAIASAVWMAGIVHDGVPPFPA